MHKVAFSKMHGTGNDFVVIGDLRDELSLPAETVAALCDRHMGIGADGVIRITRGVDAPFFMDYRNADGSLAEMCGNGVRVVGKYVADRGLATEAVDIETRAGVKRLVLHRTGALVDGATVDMGVPELLGELEETIESAGSRWVVTPVSMGNPHAVTFVDDVGSAPVATAGPQLERHERFPQGVNISFVERLADGGLRSRVWERGSGETLACGTAACAVAVAANRRGFSGDAVDVTVPGGTLRLEHRADGHIMMTGNAIEVFSGTIDLVALHGTTRG